MIKICVFWLLYHKPTKQEQAQTTRKPNWMELPLKSKPFFLKAIMKVFCDKASNHFYKTRLGETLLKEQIDFTLWTGSSWGLRLRLWTEPHHPSFLTALFWGGLHERHLALLSGAQWSYLATSKKITQKIHVYLNTAMKPENDFYKRKRWMWSSRI